MPATSERDSNAKGNTTSRATNRTWAPPLAVELMLVFVQNLAAVSLDDHGVCSTPFQCVGRYVDTLTTNDE